MRVFVTGTDTGVGKTYVSALLVRELAQTDQPVMPFKPVCCGDRNDVKELLEASGRSDLQPDEINPVWLKSPTAPLVASLIENCPVDLDQLIHRGQELARQSTHLIVEGAGGWEVPATADQTMADLAVGLDLPVLVVVDNKLGALNHTILTVQAIQARGLECKGLVLNYPREERDAASISNRMVLEEYLQIPILAEVLHDSSHLDLTPFEHAFADPTG